MSIHKQVMQLYHSSDLDLKQSWNIIKNQTGGSTTNIYKKKCRNKRFPNKLNKTGLKEYKDYKNICPEHRELTWDANICRDRNVNKILDYAKYTARYEDCYKERQDFNNKCINYSDSGHIHAIHKMLRYSNECKSRGQGKNKKDFDVYYNCFSNKPMLTNRQAKLCYMKKTKKAKIAAQKKIKSSKKNKKNAKNKKQKTWANIVLNN